MLPSQKNLIEGYWVIEFFAVIEICLSLSSAQISIGTGSILEVILIICAIDRKEHDVDKL